jgi:hypothetical protein
MKSVGQKKKGKLSAHFGCSSHKAALQQLANFVDPRGYIDLLMDKARRKEMIDSAAEIERNRDAIKIMLDITRTLARQGLAMRGSSEKNEGNSIFNQFEQLLSRQVPSFKRWLADAPKRPHAARYLSPKSKNEYIKISLSYRILPIIYKLRMSVSNKYLFTTTNSDLAEMTAELTAAELQPGQIFDNIEQ